MINGMAKVASRKTGGRKKDDSETPKFTVVRDGRVVYPSSKPGVTPNGFSEEEANRLAAALLLPAEVVPIESIDRFGRVKSESEN